MEAHVYSWTAKAPDHDCQGAQIDMLIDRADGVIDICEIKYSAEPYELNKSEDSSIVRGTILDNSGGCGWKGIVV